MGDLRTWGFLSPQLLPPTQPQFMQPGSRGEIKSNLFLVPSSMISEESQIKSRKQDLVQSQAIVPSCLCPWLADIPSVNHKGHIHVQNKNKTGNLSRMGCLFPVHQLIFRGALPTTWHWGLRDRQCDTWVVNVDVLEVWGKVRKGEQCIGAERKHKAKCWEDRQASNH